MGQLQKVSWRTAGYAALGTVLAAASVVAVVNSEGVRPTSLTSSAATRWLVDQVTGRVVLVDGLAGSVVAKIATETEGTDEVAVQGAGGAFLVAKEQGSIRTISTAKLQLGTAQAVGLLLDPGVKFGVGASGLTVVSPDTNRASVIAVDDVTRPITVPPAERAFVAADGSMWLLSDTEATHVNIDESRTSTLLRSDAAETTTVGAHAVSYDDNSSTVRWLDGGDVSLASIPNASQAVLQQPGDDDSCVWLGVGDTLLCVGATGIDRTLVIDGMNITSTDRLAIAGNAAVIVRSSNDIERIDLESRQLADDPAPTVRSGAELTITAAGDLIWIDDQAGQIAWVVHRFGINTIDKNADAPLLDAQGQVQDTGSGNAGPAVGSGNTSNDTETNHVDPNPGQNDPPVAVDDSVTARAGSTIIIPVTGNDYDPDGDAIAVLDGNTRSPTHGVADVLNGTSITYSPDLDYSGSDSFEYTLVDEHGTKDTATLSVELFPPGSPNRPPIARPDTVTTRIDRPVTIDVLVNDIDPERDLLSVPTFQNSNAATITDTIGPTGLPALEYLPPPGQAGTFRFTYQAADPHGGTSQKTVVTVEVSGADAANEPPVARPDAIRLRVGTLGKVPVMANDTDPDGDELQVTDVVEPTGVNALIASQQLNITLLPGAPEFSVVTYTLSDGIPTHDRIGKVLVLRLGDTAANRPPVANPDAERVVTGNSVKIPVTANDVDPDTDNIILLTVQSPADDAGITAVEGNSVRFTPNLPDITEPTPVTFKYRITDGHDHEAIGTVTVTVLVEALPRAPFARDDFADTVTNQPVNIDVLANDSDPSGGTPSLIGDPVCAGGGDAVRTSDDRVTFTPPTDAIGTYRCIYTVSNTQGLRAEASIIVSVTEAPQGNLPPVLNDTNLQQTVNVGGQLTLSANQLATDADADSLVFASIVMTGPGHGTTTNFVPNGPTFTYIAPPTASADNTPVADTIEVVISDGNDGTVRGSISIKIVDDSPPPSAPPSTREIQRSGLVGDLVSIDVVGELRDQNPGVELTLTSVSLDVGAGSAERANGVAVVTATDEGVVVADYIVTNAAGVSAGNKLRVTFSEPPPSNPPVAQPDTLTIASGGSASVDLLANDTGIGDPGDNVSVVLNSRPPANFASVELINGTLTVVAEAGASGSATIRYTLSDGSGESSSALITLTVLQCSESLPSAVAASIFTPYQTPINIDLNQYVTSGHIRPGSVSGAGLTGPTGTYSPPAGMNGSETVTYVVENGCQQTFQGQLVIDVNRAPDGGSVTRNVSRGSTLVLGVAELASDDEALTIVALHDNPNWLSIQSSGVSIIAVPPSNAPSQTYRFTLTVQDPGGLTANASVDLIINNIPPTAIADAYTTEDAQDSFNPLENDFDPENGQLCIQAVRVTDVPQRATVSVSPDGCGTTVTVTMQHGVHHLSYDIRDSGGMVASSTITITYNRPPTLQSKSGSTNGQSIVQIPLNVTEPDGDVVDVNCPAPPGFTTTVLPDSGPGQDPTNPKFFLIVGVPDEFNSNTNNTQAILCTASDGIAPPVSATMTVTVV